MSKYEVGDKATIEIRGANMSDYITEDYTRKRIYFDKKTLDGISEPIAAYIEPLERKNKNKQMEIEKLVGKMKRQAAEITRLLADNKRLKAENGNGLWNIEQARAEGQNEAWELARKIDLQPINGGYKRSEFEEIFGCDYISDIFEKYTYPEAAAKVAQWEKGKENKRFDESCDTCKFESTDPYFDPCFTCRHRYLSKYEPKAGEQE